MHNIIDRYYSGDKKNHCTAFSFLGVVPPPTELREPVPKINNTYLGSATLDFRAKRANEKRSMRKLTLAQVQFWGSRKVLTRTPKRP